MCCDLQPGFTHEHRFYLVQWIHSACYQCDLNLTAFSMAVALLDRLLSTIPVSLQLAQLVTIAIVSIAAKLDGPDIVEDLTRFQVRTDVWFTQYTSDDIGEMELEVLTSLEWRTHCATPADFIDRLLALAYAGSHEHEDVSHTKLIATIRSAAQRIVFSALHDSSTVALKPSSIAATAVLISMRDYSTLPDQSRAFSRISKHVDQDELQTILEKYSNNTEEPDSCSSPELQHLDHQNMKTADGGQGTQAGLGSLVLHGHTSAEFDFLLGSRNNSSSPTSTAYADAHSSRSTTASVSPKSHLRAHA